MKKNTGRKQQPSSSAARNGTAAAAAGSLCALLAAPAGAVELADIQVQSSLGQPLRASIAFALGPNEQLTSQCVYLRSGLPSQGMPTITRATATLQGNRIMLRGSVPLREPMMSLQLVVDCPYTANLTRDYMVLLNPPGRVENEAVAAPVVRERPVQAAQRTSNARQVSPAAARSSGTTAPVPAGTRYRVQAGDTLSEIVSRIDGRTLALWPAVDAVYAANPGAFQNGDVNRIIAGSIIVIPHAVAGGGSAEAGPQLATTDSATITPPVTATALPATNTRAYGGASEGVPSANVETPTSRPAPQYVDVLAAIQERNAADNAVPSAPAAEETATAAETPVDAAPANPEPVVAIPDTRIEQQPAIQPLQTAPVPVGDSGSDSAAQSWLVWLGGSGVAIFLGLLLFGRRIRERFTPNPDLDETQVNEALLNRRSSDRGEAPAPAELNFADTIGGANEIEVEEQLPEPTDFDTGDDVDMALDYSFSSSGDYSNDVDVLLDDTGSIDTEAPTAIMPGHDDEKVEETGYDMSMVLDVTKQDFSGADTTSKDLQAVEVKPLSRGSRSLDLTTEFDYKILEQDYEEELTATQALNKEIAQAALELQDRLNEFDGDRSQISMAEDLEGTAEVTAEMPARAMAGDDDDTDINSALTARLPGNDGELDLEIDDLDETVERRTKAS